MSQHLLGTNICVHYIKGEFDIRAHVRAVGFVNCFLSEITILELLYGVANSAPHRQEQNRADVTELEDTFADRILLIGPGFDDFAYGKTALRKRGRRVEDFDLLIGCTALAHDLTLVTRNVKDFANLDGLRLENWIDTP